MLGDHGGVTPLRDKDEAARILLRILGRLQVGKDVAFRRKVIVDALSSISDTDQYWLETLVSGLTAENGIESIPAHIASLATGWNLVQDDIGEIIKTVNRHRTDSFVQQCRGSLISASPKFGRRLQEGKVDSDQLLARYGLAHLFRRDPSSVFQMFAIDGAVTLIPKTLKVSIQDFVKTCIARYSESDIPEGAWGYIILLKSIDFKDGFFIYPPTDVSRQENSKLRRRFEQLMGPLSDEAFAHHATTIYVENHVVKGDYTTFANNMGAVLELMDMRFAIIQIREDDAGFITEFTPFSADSPGEARKIASKLPQISLHDEGRALMEALRQIQDSQSQRNN